MNQRQLTSEQEQEIREFGAEQARRSGANSDEMTQQLLNWTRLRGYEAFAKIKATQRALMAAYRKQPVNAAQQALITEYRKNSLHTRKHRKS